MWEGGGGGGGGGREGIGHIFCQQIFYDPSPHPQVSVKPVRNIMKIIFLRFKGYY